MALNAYLTLKGQKQGAINGSVTQKGRENSILVHAVSHSVVSPRDPASGLPTGKRMHKPFVITKEVDKSSPLLWAVLVNNENLTAWTLNFWTAVPAATAGAGIERQYYTITLVNASIASIDARMYDTSDPALASRPFLEEVAFTYQKITWTWTDGGITSSDDWSVPVV
ncbi:MAG TPA: Hcp family type VI secretion system effector [Acidobacteriaceae bacterium]|jgi:type VI secretion system secreted protein Hcp